MKRTATFDSTEQYRYQLTRSWPSLDSKNGTVTWIMLNPSTADAYQDDPTIRRCIAFTKRWGYNNLIITNIYAYRSTNPKNLLKVNDPEGKENVNYVLDAAMNSELVVVAWGAFKLGIPYSLNVLLEPLTLYCLGRTKEGHPKHPLYVRSSTLLQRFYLS